MNTYTVVRADGAEVTVESDSVTIEGGHATFVNSDGSAVADFVGYQSFHHKS